MPLLQVIVLGIVQGLTEFLPISSTAHLVVIPKLFGWPDQGLSFDIALHVGTLAAVLLYFFRDWIQILAQGFGVRMGGDPGLERNRKLLWLLIGGTIPAGIAGLLFQKQAETLWRENLYVIAGTAIGFALVMWFADYSGRKQKDMVTSSPHWTPSPSAWHRRSRLCRECPAAASRFPPACSAIWTAGQRLAFRFCCPRRSSRGLQQRISGT